MLCADVDSVDINSSNVRLINSNIKVDGSDGCCQIGGMIGRTTGTSNVFYSDVILKNSKIGFNFENTGSLGNYGSVVGGILGFAGPGSDNSSDIGKNGTTLKNCSFESVNTSKNEVIYAKGNAGAATNAGGIMGMAFNNCNIINCKVDISNGIIVSQRLLENSTENVLGSTCGGIIGRLEHTGLINGCTVNGNNLDILSKSTEREIYCGGIVGVDMGPYHKNQVSIENNNFIGNGTSKITVEVIPGNLEYNRYIAVGGIAGSSNYILKDCSVSGVSIYSNGSNENTLNSAAAKIAGMMNAHNVLWRNGTYFTPNETRGVLNCSTSNVTVNASNNSVTVGDMYGITTEK